MSTKATLEWELYLVVRFILQSYWFVVVEGPQKIHFLMNKPLIDVFVCIYLGYLRAHKYIFICIRESTKNIVAMVTAAILKKIQSFVEFLSLKNEHIYWSSNHWSLFNNSIAVSWIVIVKENAQEIFSKFGIVKYP